MSDINAVFLTGRLTRDPELRTVQAGGEDRSVANTGIAVDQYRKDQDDKAHFFDLTIWGAFGELVDKKARKGDQVTVTGRLEFSSWENDEGEKRSKVGIVVSQMEGEWMYRKADGSDTPDKADTAARDEAAPKQAKPKAVEPVDDDDIPY
jgi:single-strand DNA-binding protein